MDIHEWKLNERLRVIRHYRGFSQNEVANHLSVDRSTYAYYETGKNFPNPRTLREISIYLQVPLEFLLDLPPIPTNSDFEKLLIKSRNT